MPAATTPGPPVDRRAVIRSARGRPAGPRRVPGRTAVVTALLALTVLVASLASPAAASGPTGSAAGATVDPRVTQAVAAGPTSVIVELRAPSAGPSDQRDPAGATGRRLAARATGDRVLTRLGAVDDDAARSAQRVTHFASFATVVDAAGLATLAADPEVARILPNEAHAPALSQSVPHVGGPVAVAAGYTGAGQTVAIVDTGVEASHPFLGGRVVAEACFSTDNAGAGIEPVCPGPDPTTATGPGTGGPCPISSCSHGTHVAGIAAGDGGAFDGVAPGAQIISVQVFSKVTGTACGPGGGTCALFYDFDLTRGLDFVYGLRGTYSIAAANMSLGGFAWPGPCDFEAQKAPFDALRSAGIAPVVASGNGGVKTGISLPACLSSAVSVGAVDRVTDDVASFSNSSPYLQLLAPGMNITSSVPGAGFGSKSGTSMATPHITGAFAVLRQQHPTMTVDDLLSLMRNTGLPVTDPANGVVTPRLRLDGAVRPPTYHPLPPARVLDTRDGTGVTSAPVGPGQAIDVAVLGRGGVPASGVSAVVLNVTGVQPTASTFVTVSPSGTPVPFASNLNLVAGEVRPNLVTAKVGAGGAVSLYNATGSVHLVADVAGWYDDGGTDDTGAHHVAVLPKRIADTRDGTGVPAGRLGPGGIATVDIGSACPSAGAVAATLNVTITNPSSATHLTVFPAGQTPPLASNLNVAAGQTAPNLVVAALSADGKASIRNNSGDADVIVDLHGCELPGTSADPGGRFVAAPPARIVDTRTGQGLAQAGPLVGKAVNAVQIGGRGGIPSTGVTAVALNVTVTGPTANSHLTVAPTGLSLTDQLAASNTSVLNFVAGQTVPNLVIAKLGPDGQLLLVNNDGAAHVIVDVAGWYTA